MHSTKEPRPTQAARYHTVVNLMAGRDVIIGLIILILIIIKYICNSIKYTLYRRGSRDD